MAIGQALTVSRRGFLAPPSPVRKLMPLAVAAGARGIKVHHVNIGQPDIPAPIEMLEAIRGYSSSLLPYAPSRGMPETIAAWTDYYSIHGYGFSPEQIIVTTGGSEALWFAFMAVADHGDEIVVFEPTYANYFGFASSAGIRPVGVPLDPAGGFHLPDLATVEEHIGPATRAICIANPNNPTGTVYSAAELGMLLELAERHNLFIITDETYRELVFDGARFESIFHMAREAGREDHIIIADSISKRFSATGARIGCLATTNEEVMDAVGRFAQARLSAPTLDQLAAVPVLSNPIPYTDWLRGEYEKRRNVVFQCISEDARIRCRMPSGSFYIMVTLPIDDCDRFAAWLLTDFESEGETLMVAPGSGFYLAPDAGLDQARLAFVLNEDDLARAVTLLSEALDRYPMGPVAGHA
ncbi:MAG TPA: pyridoxal phosphate-dependent aminotransferase [Chloroflexota bacterium]|nr:pyridoxal phosphate-dependent aminotransferase [Chloroflexota bacterium]